MIVRFNFDIQSSDVHDAVEWCKMHIGRDERQKKWGFHKAWSLSGREARFWIEDDEDVVTMFKLRFG